MFNTLQVLASHSAARNRRTADVNFQVNQKSSLIVNIYTMYT